MTAALVDQAAQSAEPVWRTSIRPTKRALPGGAGEEQPAKICANVSPTHRRESFRYSWQWSRVPPSPRGQLNAFLAQKHLFEPLMIVEPKISL